MILFDHHFYCESDTSS